MKNLILVIAFLFIVGCSSSDNKEIRVALYNIKELSTEKIMDTDENGEGKNAQLIAAAKIINEVAPDILILNEIDWDYNNKDYELNTKRFIKNYLSEELQNKLLHVYSNSCNTGILSGKDLNNDGKIAKESDLNSFVYGGDSYGWGVYPGQYSMAIISEYEIDENEIRTFQKFLWKNMPGNHIPEDYYSEDELEIFRLSSKSHWDIPIKINDKEIHFLLSHPTPPVFDGEEDRNGRRNFDEIKFWNDYINNEKYIYDDNKIYGGLVKSKKYIIAGDLNASPTTQKVYDNSNAINQLLTHPNIKDTGKWLTSKGGYEGLSKGTPNYNERNTAQFSRGTKTRIDYLLTEQSLKVTNGGVYWPSSIEDSLKNKTVNTASDHRLLWLDIKIH